MDWLYEHFQVDYETELLLLHHFHKTIDKTPMELFITYIQDRIDAPPEFYEELIDTFGDQLPSKVELKDWLSENIEMGYGTGFMVLLCFHDATV